MSGFAAASASRPARTEACRVAPPLTGGAWRSPRTASSNITVSSGFTTGWTRDTCGCELNASIARKITGRPPMDRYCLGPPAPARRPRPAATRMAAVRGGVVMGVGNQSVWEQRSQRFAGWGQALIMLTSGGQSDSCGLGLNQEYAALHLQDSPNCLKCRHET